MFGKKISSGSGIGQLMEDLGITLTEKLDMLMLGGGNPAHIPEVQKYFRESMEKLLANGTEFERTIGNYGPPGGNMAFIEAISQLLKKELAWEIKPQNIALTSGSQTAFFILFNIFAGAFEDGSVRKILFPLAPEYIGYCDVGLIDDLFIANKPKIQYIDDHIFKYHIDFDRIGVTGNIGAICLSRPTNPTGNVLTDSEIRRLSDIACANDIPLIIDNAYGAPFPGIIFTDVKTVWNEHTIFCMSLSKLGLPAARTGIIIANEEVISMVSKINAVMSLAPGSIGAAIVNDLVGSGKIIDLSCNIIKPFYQQKAQSAMELVLKEFDGVNFHIHKPEGTFFLWLWFPDLPVTSRELYQRLKKRGVLIVPGYYFFPGIDEHWPHKNECIRINYSQDAQTVSKGIKIIAEEVKKAYKTGRS
ncbi:MAG: valine--pyruvate transaminase [Sedimentisphaerales bacterium]|nr:valine--pyruvate transaminase [Sedimentisphaerales bacterium]